ncbi:MAG: hypothetical protein HZB68_05635 [Candidatus Aenigmarchaeota archaeon]|nr:hypothetical protein [Candidatus Aenigmarchaeota archaeon]
MAIEIFNLGPLVQGINDALFSYLPHLVLAFVILLAGYIIGKIAGSISNKVLVQAKINEYLHAGEHFKFEVAHVFSLSVRWVIYLAFMRGAVNEMNNAALGEFFATMQGFLFGIVEAGALILISFVLGVYIKDHIVGSHTHHADLMGRVVMYIFLFLGVNVGLEIALPGKTALVTQIIVILVAAVGLGLAIALGFGLKDVIAKMAEDFAVEYKEKAKHHSTKKA